MAGHCDIPSAWWDLGPTAVHRIHGFLDEAADEGAASTTAWPMPQSQPPMPTSGKAASRTSPPRAPTRAKAMTCSIATGGQILADQRLLELGASLDIRARRRPHGAWREPFRQRPGLILRP
ncbi:hypothetical protein D3C76_855030 [compost metagenome]